MSLHTSQTPHTSETSGSEHTVGAAEHPSANPQQVGRKVHFETWGCQMNVADSENMLALLEKQQNYSLSHDAEDADLIVLNTCHIREKAKHKVMSRLGKLKYLKDRRPSLRIALAGCVAQADGKSLQEWAPFIDVVIGPGTVNKLPELLAKAEATGEAQRALGFRESTTQRELLGTNIAPKAITGRNEVSRFINIAQGCDNFCTFCVVPFTRGRERSEMPEDILERMRVFIDQGAREITLLGQNVNSYGLDLVRDGKLTASKGGPFVDLLAKAADLPGLERLRFTTSNPHDFTPELAQLFASKPSLGRYMHLPVQSGSDSILDSMKRKVTVEEYWERIHWLRSAVPDIAISTDLIVGFPGETEEDFQGTMQLVEKLRYAFVYAFKYSPRRGTAASRFRTQVEEQVKDRRLAELNDLQNAITIEQNATEVGKEREVLFLYQSRKDAEVYYGRTQHFRLVKVISKNRVLTGSLGKVLITGSNKTALEGHLV